MRGIFAFAATAIGAAILACAYALIANSAAGAWLIGYSMTSVLVVASIFGLLSVAPIAFWHLVSAKETSLVAFLVTGFIAGAALYVGNVMLGMAGNPLSLFGIGLCGAFGAAATYGGYLGRRAIV